MAKTTGSREGQSYTTPTFWPSCSLRSFKPKVVVSIPTAPTKNHQCLCGLSHALQGGPFCELGHYNEKCKDSASHSTNRPMQLPDRGPSQVTCTFLAEGHLRDAGLVRAHMTPAFGRFLAFECEVVRPRQKSRNPPNQRSARSRSLPRR